MAMEIRVEKPIPREKWLGALGADSRQDIRDALETKMQAAEDMLLQAAKPKAVYRLMEKGQLPLPGSSIKAHLKGCPQVVLLGLTLGIEVDRLIQQTQIGDMALAVLLDSGASLLTEKACDQMEEQIAREVAGFLTPRFSPGYGDFPLTVQKQMVDRLDGMRRIGLYVSGGLMIPRKSVTALMGVADRPVKGQLATCGQCVLREKCELRKRGEFCGN